MSARTLAVRAVILAAAWTGAVVGLTARVAAETRDRARRAPRSPR